MKKRKPKQRSREELGDLLAGVLVDGTIVLCEPTSAMILPVVRRFIDGPDLVWVAPTATHLIATYVFLPEHNLALLGSLQVTHLAAGERMRWVDVYGHIVEAMQDHVRAGRWKLEGGEVSPS